MSTATIDFDMDFDDSQQSEADKKLFVTFFREAVHNEFKSIEAGRPVFDDVDMVRIMYPGQRDTTVGRAHDGYTERFPKQWAQYQRKVDQTTSGTPLTEVSWLTRGQVAEMAAVNIHSVDITPPPLLLASLQFVLILLSSTFRANHHREMKEEYVPCLFLMRSFMHAVWNNVHQAG